MTQQCPRCNSEMVLQKAASTFSRQSFLYCRKCQTTIFLPQDADSEQSPGKGDNQRKPKALLVDDDTDLLTLLDLQFKTAGFDTVLATNGEEAYNKLIETTPDLIIADIFLPTIDGWELTKKIRNSSELGYVPIVLVTGIYTGPEFKAKALENGVDAFVTKPYDHEALLNIAHRLVEQFTGLTIKGEEATTLDDPSLSEPSL